MKPTVGSLFSGIGGLDLGFERAGFEVRWQVEIDRFCRAVLAKHWPDVQRYEDVRACGVRNLERVDCVVAGPPCQPISNQGHRRGSADERWLWPECIRVLGELRPRVAVLENPTSIAFRELGTVLELLADVGFDAEWTPICPTALGGPQYRERLWIVAYPHNGSVEGIHAEPRVLPTPEGVYRLRFLGRDAGADGRAHAEGILWPAEPDVVRVADGIPDRVDRVVGLGNAVVPQVAEVIARRVREVMEQS